MKNLIALILLASPSSFAQALNVEAFYHELAAYHSPIIYHFTGGDPKGDIPTRFDYDGDFRANNNWENFTRHELLPAVYYGVSETATHYFINYGFYHPRDYAKVCLYLVCHENDLEGSLVVVRKRADLPFGYVEYAETQAHSKISRHKNPVFYEADGPVLRYRRIVFWIQAQGHGVYAGVPKIKPKMEIYAHGSDMNSSGLPKTPKHYDLVPIRELWDLMAQENPQVTFKGRFDFNNGRFQIKGLWKSFNSDNFFGSTASLPWSWKDGAELSAPRGEIYLDPANWAYRRSGQPSNFSRDYLYNFPLGINQLSP